MEKKTFQKLSTKEWTWRSLGKKFQLYTPVIVLSVGKLSALETKLVSRLREMVVVTVVSNLVTIHLRSCKLPF